MQERTSGPCTGNYQGTRYNRSKLSYIIWNEPGLCWGSGKAGGPRLSFQRYQADRLIGWESGWNWIRGIWFP